MSNYQRCIKRTFDLLCSCIGLVLLLIPGIIIVLLILILSPGPIFFIQQRIGQHGKTFSVIKFSTMYIGSEHKGTITSAIDNRITPIGHFLRKFKLDELPQLWNVLIGKMSLVGPRPDVAGYADKLMGENRKILELKPGITGPASLYFRNEEEVLAQVDNLKQYNDTVIWPKKVELNLDYYYHWSFWKDIGYILRTILPGLNRYSL
jgi:lipopolysaccharide/colanic/teichoic acid biosynthesis glycosyltransferase